MTTSAQLLANRRNAQRCTGPKTPEGKHRSAKNALRHGLRAELPVIPGEDPAAWEAHRAGLIRDMVPAGPLEEALAEQVALTLWRLRRSAAYEVAVVSASIARHAEETRLRAERAGRDPGREARDHQPAAVRLAVAGPAGAEALARVRGVLSGVWRASSLVEGINSVLRMQQSRHRRLTQGLLDLKRLYWNCHRFRTGKRRRRSRVP